MRRQLVWLGCLAATAAPAVLGLSGNQSFSRDISVRVPPQATSVVAVPPPALARAPKQVPRPSTPTTAAASSAASPAAPPTRLPVSASASHRGQGNGEVAEDRPLTGTTARPGNNRAVPPDPADDHGGIAVRRSGRAAATQPKPESTSGSSGSGRQSGRSGADDTPDDS